MRRAAKIDANQNDIVDALRAAGCSVRSLAAVGDGMADLLVGDRGENFLMEVKDGTKPPSARKLTPDQDDFHANWQGQVAVVKNVREALMVLGYQDEAE